MIKIYTKEKKRYKLIEKLAAKTKCIDWRKPFQNATEILSQYILFSPLSNNHIFKRFIFLLQPFDTSFRAFRTRNTNMIWIICKMHFTFCYTMHSFLVVLFYFSFFFCLFGWLFVYLFVLIYLLICILGFGHCLLHKFSSEKSINIWFQLYFQFFFFFLVTWIKTGIVL